VKHLSETPLSVDVPIKFSTSVTKVKFKVECNVWDVIQEAREFVCSMIFVVKFNLFVLEGSLFKISASTSC
jgi:hypothetical protein